MAWSIDYFIRCNSCQNQEWMDGKTIAIAAATARKAGWYVKGKIALCPRCVEEKKKSNA